MQVRLLCFQGLQFDFKIQHKIFIRLSKIILDKRITPQRFHKLIKFHQNLGFVIVRLSFLLFIYCIYVVSVSHDWVLFHFRFYPSSPFPQYCFLPVYIVRSHSENRMLIKGCRDNLNGFG